ncbi:hypothetical protein JKP88DRAFT_248985 [Tribonema minus]|uniref:Right handed beta helix domain-containing protein n=1 Tax=Tribonema minus TaxID=303371 RepID=A0A836C8P5_9STRA|nr:hypothetical protein JKP88DRAFT_248985 [Tribonema minus]
MAERDRAGAFLGLARGFLSCAFVLLHLSGCSSAPCAEAPQSLVVSSAREAAELADAVKCGGGVFRVAWDGDVQLPASSIHVGPGTQMIIVGRGDAIVRGTGKHRLFQLFRGSSLKLAGLRLTGGYDDVGGAILVGPEGSLRLDNCTFAGNKAAEMGGTLALAEGASAVMLHSSVRRSSAPLGGMAYAYEGSSLTLFNSTLDNSGLQADARNTLSTWPRNGGAIYLSSQSSLSMQQATIADCTASWDGGAVYAAATSSISASNCSFHKNRATAGDGGGLYSSGTVSLTECQAIANFAGASGGFMHLAPGASTSMRSVHMSRNTAKDKGGAIHAWLPHRLRIGASNVTSNGAAVGGGLFAQLCNNVAYGLEPDPQTLVFVDQQTTFDSNTAECCYVAVMLHANVHMTSGSYDVGGQETQSCTDVHVVAETGYNTACCSRDEYATNLDGDPHCEACSELQGLSCGNTPDNSVATLQLNPGWWRRGGSQTKAQRCMNEKACKGDSPITAAAGSEVATASSSSTSLVGTASTSSTSFVATTSTSSTSLSALRDTAKSDAVCEVGYRGPYCAVCAEDYAPGLVAYTCHSCSSGSAAATGAVACIVIVVLLVVCYIVGAYLLDIGEVADATGTCCSACKAIGTTQLGTLVRRIPFAVLRSAYVLLTILVQSVSLSGLHLPSLYSDFLQFLNLISLDLGVLMSPGCLIRLDFYDKLLITTLAPLAGLLVLCAMYAWSRRRLRHACAAGVHTSGPSAFVLHSSNFSERVDVLFCRYQLVVLVCCFLILPPTSTTILSTFSCDLGFAINDMGKVATITAAELPYVAGFLRADYNTRCNAVEGPWRGYAIYASFMTLVYPIGIPLAFWVLLWRQRRDIMCTTTAQAADNNARVHSTAFLWKQYRPEVWWWEVAECVRRLLMISVVGVFSQTPAVGVGKAALPCTLTVLNMVAVGLAMPHKERWELRHYWLGCWILFGTYFSSLMMEVYYGMNKATETALSAVLIALNVLLLIATAYQVFLTFKQTQAEGGARQNSFYGLRQSHALPTSVSDTSSLAPASSRIELEMAIGEEQSEGELSPSTPIALSRLPAPAFDPPLRHRVSR